MANWVKGKLKIRGKPEDIKRWVEECLHCYFTKWFRDSVVMTERKSFIKLFRPQL